MDNDNEFVVTVTPTIMDGQVVRWFRSISAAERGYAFVSASRNGVIVDTGSAVHGRDLDQLRQLMDLAGTVAEDLRHGKDWRLLATHEREFISGPMVPVARG